MMSLKRLSTLIAGALALSGLCVQSAAAAQDAPSCVPQAQAEGLVLSIMPSALQAMQQTCSASLPQGAFLRAIPAERMQAYEAAAAAALPRAAQAVQLITGQQLGEAQFAMIQPMIGAMVGPMLAQAVKPDQCGAANRIATQLAPLPPENLAALIVTFVQLRAEDKDQAGSDASGMPELHICPVDAG